MEGTYYLTTPIYYVNDVPHLGHAYTTFAADTVARFRRLNGDTVAFATGTDEHSKKNVAAALRANTPIDEYVRQMAARWQLTWDTLNLSYSRFVRTTEPSHAAAVVALYERLKAHGDVYEGTYEGYYCLGCEEYITEGSLVEGKCPIHKTVPERVKEENLFFKASRYREAIISHIEAHPEFIAPDGRRKELLSYLAGPFSDVSISRKQDWGIAVPDKPGHVFYVWFDALVSYLTAVGYGAADGNAPAPWPPQLQLIGKDILKFHGGMWLAMLMAAELGLPERIFAHGFFTIAGQKMSKSLGNAVDPLALTAEFGVDAVRYFLMREFPFGGDGDFSRERLVERYNGDLANGLGNTVARILALAQKLPPGAEPGEIEVEFEGALAEAWEHWEKALTVQAFDEALAAIWEVLSFVDVYLETHQPWKMKATSPEYHVIVAQLLECLRNLGWLLNPLMPETAEKIWTALDIGHFERNRTMAEARVFHPRILPIKRGASLFPRLAK